MKRNLEIIILAGGQGKRMKSKLPKPLHTVGGIPTINRIVDSATPLSRMPIIVIGNYSTAIIDATHNKYRYVVQQEQHGTGHAVLTVRDALTEHPFGADIMVIPGDHPFISTNTLENIYDLHKKNDSIVTIGTFTVPNFNGDHENFFHYGRIVRNQHGAIHAIVELKDATSEEKTIREVNVSYYCFNTEWLWKNINALKNINASGEFYLTDMIHIAASQNIPIHSYAISDIKECMGFNTPEQLEALERFI